jgi:hypothetical protein
MRRLHSERTQLTASTLAILRSAAAVTALERFRRTNGGTLPQSLSALVPAFLSAVPIDPYSGEPLRYLRGGARYAVYSIGKNEKDDGGIDLNPQGANRWNAYSRSRQPADVGVEIRLAPAGR